MQFNSNISCGSVHKFKLIFLGDQSVGKTSIINRFILGDFKDATKPTVGIDFVTKILQYEGKTVRLQLWDTAGQERFRSLIPCYIRDAHAAIIVFDISKSHTLSNIKQWFDYIIEERGEDIQIILAGNKCDLESENMPALIETMESLSKKHNCLTFRISAKTGENVSAMFMGLVSQIFNESSIKGSEKREEPIQLLRSDSKDQRGKSREKCC